MPTVNPSAWGPKPQFLLASGLPAVGNLLFWYVGGSVNTKLATYTDSTGTVANTNPIVLNALGEPTTEIWLQQGLVYKAVYAPSTDTDPPTSPIWTVDNIRGQNDVTATQDQWVASGLTPTFVSGTSFTLAGDQTSAFAVGRRLKTTNSGGTIYSTISASVFAALTTITVINDSGVLDSGLSAISYGLLTSTSGSVPFLFPVGSSGTRLLSNGTTAAWQGTWFKTLSFTRSAASASGNVAYTGVGFKPKAAMFNMSISGTTAASSGSDDGVTAMSNGQTGGNFTPRATGVSIVADDGIGGTQAGSVLTFDADGLTIAWTKTATPAGTMVITALLFR